ncbi:MAG: hypothetical protein ACI9BF_000023 [Candidatus Paceibacteria bacterium]|jgi:hypothetical protein
MTLFITLVAILQPFSISLGVGSSTLAIVNFFVTIADGAIDETERRMMGVVYVVLRVATLMILLTTGALVSIEFTNGGIVGFSTIIYAQLLTLIMLFVNASLMTARVMPSTYGPALQAGSWYTLGTLSALQIVGIVNFSFLNFLFGYITWLILAVAIVNGIMSVLAARRKGKLH